MVPLRPSQLIQEAVGLMRAVVPYLALSDVTGLCQQASMAHRLYHAAAVAMEAINMYFDYA
ncbi:GPI-anchored surface protein, putative [Bodo saltans]|uniref:GPI-anchored surface protein, putative n=1 Tax=Bodo saltans TaxID=75058 RepID=A0A0S4JJG9_BODSA|nr:GPI-anchored surface protein, putative [Bodo saltans]|eukprot:CUG90487.1 GPI-anchored surface protein, putative [Bodo saltans]